MIFGAPWVGPPAVVAARIVISVFKAWVRHSSYPRLGTYKTKRVEPEPSSDKWLSIGKEIKTAVSGEWSVNRNRAKM